MIKVGGDDIMEVLMDSEEIGKAYYQNYLVYVKPVRQPSYIKNGLVFWLDGIDKGNIPDAWVEKKQGYVFANHGAVFNTDHVYLNGSSYLDCSGAFTALSESGTIEVVYEKDYDLGVIIQPAYISNANYIAYGKTGGAGFVWDSRSAKARYNNDPYIASVSISGARALGNGFPLTQNSTGSLTNTSGSPAHIGVANNMNYYFTGKIYCIRVYNRQLTEEEVLANYAVDIQRFNLDLDEYITFADPVVEQICVSTWGDGTGLTKGRAQLVKQGEIYTAFTGNTEIKTFDELRFFGARDVQYSTFNGCTALTSITLPDGMYGNIGNGVFTNATLMATLNLGNGHPAFGSGNSPQLNYILNIKIKDIVQYLDFFRNVTAMAFGNLWARYESNGAHLINASTNQEITSVTIPSGITNIPWTCFNNMKSITSVTLPSSVTEIKGYAFYGCSGLTSITIPSSITAIGSNAFQLCSSLSSITIPSNVTTIGANAFGDCSRLQNLSILANITINASNISQGNTGDGTGSFYFAGSISSLNSTALQGFAKVRIDGDVTMAASQNMVSSICKILKIGGDYDITANSYGFGRDCAALEFVEVKGSIICGGTTNIVSAYFNPTNCIAHFEYDGLVAQFSSVGRMGNFMNKVQMVYVGDGSSASHDNAILAQYTADADWSAYSSKLDTWYNYVNDPNANQDFIN